MAFSSTSYTAVQSVKQNKKSYAQQTHKDQVKITKHNFRTIYIFFLMKTNEERMKKLLPIYKSRFFKLTITVFKRQNLFALSRAKIIVFFRKITISDKS